ncbi:hypothetical protein [Saccharopolyspora erythraea]|uniref:hypothetical protein n=1 Tax=Saccharopolyspora erythraea TaxID=1836 RepID=UPI0012FB2A98|nr:hypothetical protein [Saccharopolyspora erythraea]
MLTRFDPIGHVDDVGDEARKLWSDAVKSIFQQVRAGQPVQKDNDAPRSQFYDPTETETAADAVEAEISWSAFPRQIRRNFPGDTQRWRRAEASREVQDEYLEWSATRDSEGKIRKVTFTCEPREWWTFLAQTAPETLVRLYQTFLSEQVSKADLFDSQGTTSCATGGTAAPPKVRCTSSTIRTRCSPRSSSRVRPPSCATATATCSPANKN